jgi:hypothetical protein
LAQPLLLELFGRAGEVTVCGGIARGKNDPEDSGNTSASFLGNFHLKSLRTGGKMDVVQEGFAVAGGEALMVLFWVCSPFESLARVLKVIVQERIGEDLKGGILGVWL